MATMVVEGVEPHPNDIKCGRGHGSNMHPGNKYYQQRVLEFENEYQESRGNYDKNRIAQTILDGIESRSPPGRFLELSHANGQEIWLVMMDHSTVIKKIKQALRDVKKGSSSSKKSTKTSPSTPPPTSISPPRHTSTTIQSEEAINYPEQVSQNYRHHENNDDNENNEWSPPRSQFAASMPPLLSTPLIAQELIAMRDCSSVSNLSTSTTQHNNDTRYHDTNHQSVSVDPQNFRAYFAHMSSTTQNNYTRYHDTNHQSVSVDPQNFRAYFAHMSSTTGGTTGAGIGLSTGSGTGLNRDSLDSLKSADVELLRTSLESFEIRDSFQSVDMEVISETVFDEQK